MTKIPFHVLLGLAAAPLASAVAVATAGAEGPRASGPGGSAGVQGPPPYLTLARHERLEDIPAGERGNFVAGPEGPMPTRFVPSVRPADPATIEQWGGTGSSRQAVGGAVGSTNASDSYQGEPMLAAGGGLLVGGQNDIYPGNCIVAAAPGAVGDCGVSASASADGGTTWTRTKLPRTWGGHTYVLGFDPSIAYDGAAFHYAYGVADDGTNVPNGIVVASSTDGVNWTQKTPVVLHTGSTTTFEDKYWIAADSGARTWGTRSLYVGWDRNRSLNQTLLVSSSRNSGASWSTPTKVNDGSGLFERVIGAYPAVDQRNGTVYMAWHDYARNRIFVDKSVDGGVTWGTDVTVATTNTGFGMDIGCNGGRSMSPSLSLAVSRNGVLLVVYANNVAGNGFDILATKSTDGGTTWTPPKRVNDDPPGTGAHQYNPAASIDPSGFASISWLDRRDDPGNCLTHAYAAVSTDGRTLRPNVRLTGDGRGPAGTGQSNFGGNANGPGDYGGSASAGGVAHPYYARHVDGDAAPGGGFDVYSSTVTP